MADTILQCDGIAESGLKLFLYALPGATGTPTAAGYSLAAVSGVPGRYTATVADALVGDFLVFVHDDQTEADAGTGNYGPGYVTLADDTSTYVVGGDNGLSSFAKADVNAEVDTAINDAALPAATADAIWDEAYADHTSAGTFGKLMDIIRKANLSVDGTVSGTPTVNTFDTDLTDPTSTHKHQLLVFTSGALEGVSRPILSYTQTNGQIVLQEDLPSAPSASDEFTILIQHVHPVSEIQDGLATQASVDAIDGNVDAIKAKTDQFVFSVANQVDANALTGGGGGDATLTKQNEILSRLSGVAITTTGRVASGGALTLYLGDDHKVRSGTELEISVSDVGGALYTKLDALGTSALTFGAARLDQSPGQITGTIAAIDTSGSGADEVCVITVEITAAGEGLRPADDYEYQIAQKQTQGSDIDDYVEISGTLTLLRRRVATGD